MENLNQVISTEVEVSEIPQYDLRIEQLSKADQFTYEVIKEVNDELLSVDQAKLMLDIKDKRVNELIDAYINNRLEVFVTENKERLLKTKEQKEFEYMLCTKYRSKPYKGCAFGQFADMLQNDNIFVKQSHVAKILNSNYLYSSAQLAKKGEAIQKELERARKIEKDEVLLKNINYTLQRIDHRGGTSLPRVYRMGLVCEADASSYDWFGIGVKLYLTIIVDACTSAIVGAWLHETESSVSHFNALYQCVQKYGPPKKIITDFHRAITQAQKYTQNDKNVNDKFSVLNYDTTEYCLTCRQLGIELMVTSNAKGKPHVERANQTLQGRLPHEFMARGIRTKEAANEFLLNEYIEKYNEEFAVEALDDIMGFGNVTASMLTRLPYMFSKIQYRKVTSGNEINYNKRYCIYDRSGIRCSFDKDTEAIIIDSYFSDLLLCVIDDEVYSLHEMVKYATPGVNVFQREPEDLPGYMPIWGRAIIERHCQQMRNEFYKLINQPVTE